MTDLLPNVNGPKLFSFKKDLRNLIFVRQLSSDEDFTSDRIPHGRVFEVKFGLERKAKKYALKIWFNFFSLGELRPFVPLREHLLDDHIVRHHIDPFFAECRAFGRLIEEGKDNALAVRCHGYAFLPREIEVSIAQDFGIEEWNRKAEHEGQPLRAIVKDVIRFNSPFGRTDFPADSPFGQRKFSAMRKIVEEVNKLRILIMDVRRENYRGGRLFDFSIAITSPDMALDQNLRSKKKILEDMEYDLECFDSMVEEVQKAETQRTEATQSTWDGRLRKRPQKT